MKGIHNIKLMILAMMAALAACTQDEDFVPRGDGDAVKISASTG